MDPSSYHQNVIDAQALESKQASSSSPPSSNKVKSEDNVTTSSKTNEDNNPKIPSNIPQSLLPLTEEELSLLRMYETIRSYEKRADQARAAAAMEVLAAADREHKRKQEDSGGGRPRDDEDDEDDDEPAAAVSSKPTSNDRSDDNDDDGDGMVYFDDGGGGGESSDESLGGGRSRNNSPPSSPTTTKDAQRRQAEEEEKDRLIREGEDNDDDGVHVFKKARKDSVDYDSDDSKPGASLIENIVHASTPLHDLSSKLKMSKVSGTQMFPDAEGVVRNELTWTPPGDAETPEDGCLQLHLDGFDAAQVALGTGSNTIAIKFVAPRESRRFSINIAAPNHDNYNSVLFHFNPRQFEKGGLLVINDKQEGTWGQGVNVPLASMPVMFGQPSSTLILQITGDGFDIFLEGKHCARLEHRAPLPQDVTSLVLQMPSTDDKGKTETWSVFKVWWGNKPPMAKDLSNVPGVNTHNHPHPKKLFISGLSKIRNEYQVDLRRAELERAFRKYGGAHGITATVPTNSTFAFVEVETERQADLALTEMKSKYRLNRARRSKHEALMEKRAAAALKDGGDVGGGKNEWG